MSTRSLIVFRHAVDVPNGTPFYNDNIDYPLPDVNDPNSPIHLDDTRLSKKSFGGDPIGVDQAANIGKRLTKWMKTMGMNDVGKVITQDPRGGTKSTPNPFNTVYPAVDPAHYPEVKQKPVSFEFFGEVSEIIDGHGGVLKSAETALFDGNYSTLVCMTRQSMWSHEKQKNGRKYPSHDSFLGALVTSPDGSSDAHKQKMAAQRELMILEPKKCRSIYVFQGLIPNTCNFESLHRFTLHHDGIRAYSEGDW